MEEWVREEGLRVNVGKTKVIKCGVGLKKTVDTGSTLVGCVVRVSNPTPYSVRYA